MTRPRIEEIRERAEAATEGPWHVRWPDTVHASTPIADSETGRGDGAKYLPCIAVPPNWHDEHRLELHRNMLFIAASRTDIPALCAYVLELEKQNAHLRQQAEQWAQEARTQRSTVLQSYQAATGATGEPGDWHGAEPIRERLSSLGDQNKRLREALEPFATAEMRGQSSHILLGQHMTDGRKVLHLIIDGDGFEAINAARQALQETDHDTE